MPDAVTAKALFEFLDPIVHAIEEGQSTTLPAFAYYGVSRAVLEIPERRRDFRKEFRRFDGLENALEPTARFKGLFEWFQAQERDAMEHITQLSIDGSTPAFSPARTQAIAAEQISASGTLPAFFTTIRWVLGAGAEAHPAAINFPG